MTAPPHISDELPRMLTGEADRDTVIAAAAHLRDCIDCQHELVSALVAHASLSSAQRFAPEIVAGTFTGNFTDAAEAAPFPGSDLSPARHAVGDESVDVDEQSRPLPDLSALFAQVRAEADAESRTERAPQPVASLDVARTRRTRYLVGAAAAAVIVGAGGVIYGVTAGDHSASPSGRSVALAAYDVGKSPATATVGSGTMSIDATSLPKLAGKRYEVWLTNTKRTALQPIGWIGSNGKADLTVPKDLMSMYSDVEVSVQDLSASSYDYSGVSVLRGSLD